MISNLLNGKSSYCSSSNFFHTCGGISFWPKYAVSKRDLKIQRPLKDCVTKKHNAGHYVIFPLSYYFVTNTLDNSCSIPNWRQTCLRTHSVLLPWVGLPNLSTGHDECQCWTFFTVLLTRLVMGIKMSLAHQVDYLTLLDKTEQLFYLNLHLEAFLTDLCSWLYMHGCSYSYERFCFGMHSRNILFILIV